MSNSPSPLRSTHPAALTTRVLIGSAIFGVFLALGSSIGHAAVGAALFFVVFMVFTFAMVRLRGGSGGGRMPRAQL